jgi:hypothetical protein
MHVYFNWICKFLSKRIEQERQLDTALLQSGKFKDALASLLQWLSDSEDLVAHLKPPAADYKVLKTQLQEQKVQICTVLPKKGHKISFDD